MGQRHHLPHFHAAYQGQQAVFGIDPVVLLAGSLPARQRRLVEQWAKSHQSELLRNWALLQAGRRPFKIKGP